MQLTTEGITKAMRDDRTVTVNSHEIGSALSREELPIGIDLLYRCCIFVERGIRRATTV